MYKNSIVRLIIGKVDTTIPFEVGVKQGESMAPVLFLFLIMGFAGTLEKEWVKNGLHKLQFRRHDNSPQSEGRLTSHPKNISPKEHYSPFSACSTLTMAHSPSSLGKNLNSDHQ